MHIFLINFREFIPDLGGVVTYQTQDLVFQTQLASLRKSALQDVENRPDI